MRYRQLLFCLLITLSAPLCAVEDIPMEAANCSLSTPPREAGESSNHGRAMKIYPRKADISLTYTGCQILWFEQTQNKKDFEKIWVIYFESGKAVAEKTFGSIGNHLCIYREGKLASGQPKGCDKAPPKPFVSFPPGCSGSHPRPPHCMGSDIDR